jgi:hypothetical protein
MGSDADGLAALLVSATAVDGDAAVCASTALPSLEVMDVIISTNKTLHRDTTGIFLLNPAFRRTVDVLDLRIGLFLFLCYSSCVARK